MRIIIFIITFLILVPSYASPPPGAEWDWQLSEVISPPNGIKVFGTDPDNVTKKQILLLNNAGIYTICYISVGTLENWRDDVDSFEPNMVGKKYDDWPDENFLDISNPDLIEIMARRFVNCSNKGFLAIEPDNIDVYDSQSGFNITKEQTIFYIKQLVKIAHGLNLEIGQKNVPELTSQLVDIMDFIIAESCYQDGWCEDILPYISAGKPIFDAEYNDKEIDFEAACIFAKKHKISMILKDRELSKDYQTCD